MKDKTEHILTIEFWELVFLAEVCIPPVPIARGGVWDRIIDIHYKNLTDWCRNKLFEIITKRPNFDKNNEDCQWFYARYNPSNQFKVHCFFQGKPQIVDCFRKDNEYFVGKNKSINMTYVKKITKMIDGVETEIKD